MYDLYFPYDKKLVPLKVTSIYYLTSEGEKEHYMIYEGEELNLIERLIKANVIKDFSKEENYKEDDLATNNVVNNNIEDNNSLTE